MLWWIGVIAGGLAAARLWDGNRALAWVAAVLAIVGFWTAGIANNFNRGEEQAIPGAAAVFNIVSVVGGLAALIASFLIS